MKTIRRYLSSVMCAAMVLLCMTVLTGCASKDWNGTWNREGDATYSKASIVITEARGSGFYFSLTVYNGNLAGRLEKQYAQFTSGDKDVARYYSPGSDCFIEFRLDGGKMNVNFNSDRYVDYVDENNEGVPVVLTEQTVLGFSDGGYVGGQYVREQVEYMNTSLTEMGVCEQRYDDQLRDMMTADMYERTMNCFQQYETVRNDEIGGYIVYGSNVLQKYAAAMICYDDDSVSLVVTTEIGGISYYTNNHIYTSSLLPYPLSNWIDEYNTK